MFFDGFLGFLFKDIFGFGRGFPVFSRKCLEKMRTAEVKT